MKRFRKASQLQEAGKEAKVAKSVAAKLLSRQQETNGLSQRDERVELLWHKVVAVVHSV